MPVESYISGKLLDTLSAGCISHLDRKIRTSVFYQNVQNLLHNSNFPEEISMIFSSSINMAKSTVPEENLVKEDIEESLKLNSILMYEWLTSFDDPDYYQEIEKVQYSNYEKRKDLRIFFSNLYNQIFSHRKSNSFALIIQNNDGLRSMNTTLKDFVHNQTSDMDLLKKQVGLLVNTLNHDNENITEWEFSSELKEIEELLNEKKSKLAREKALLIKEKILQNNKRNEKEKLYQLIVNSYIQEIENQAEAIPYLFELISVTEDIQKKQYRKIMLLLLEKQDEVALQEIDSIDSRSWSKENYTKIIEFKLNIFYHRSQFVEANKYLEEIGEEFNDNIFWKIETNLLLNDYKKAYEIYLSNLEFFDREKFRYKKVKFEVLLSYYAYEIRQCNNTFENNINIKELIPLADELISLANDDSFQSSTLHCQKAYCLGLIDDYTESLKEYQKAEELYPENTLLLRNYPLSLLATGKQRDKIKALEFLSKYLKQYENDKITLSLYYKILVEVEPDKAIRVLEPIEIKEENIEHIILLSDAYLASFMNEESFNLLDSLQVKFPNNYLVPMQFGNHYYKVKDPRKSLEYYYVSLSKNIPEPWKMEVITRMGNLLLSLNSNDRLEELELLLFGSYDEEFILFNFRNIYLECLFRKEKYRECLLKIQKIIDEGSFEYSLFRYKFYCYIQTKNYGKAIESFNEMLSYDKSNNSDLLQFAHCHLELGHSDAALRVLPQLDDPKSAQDYVIRSQFLIQLLKYNDALKIIHQGYKLFPFDRNIQEVFISLVITYNAKPQDHSVISDYQKCIDTYDKMPFDNKMMKLINLPEDKNAENILKVLDEAIETFNHAEKPEHKTYEKIVCEIQEKKLPLSMNPRTSSENYIYIWGESLLDKQTPFFGAYGNKYDYLENGYLHKKEIFIDLSSILFIFKLHLESKILVLFTKVYVAQSIWSLILNASKNDHSLFKKTGFNSVLSEEKSEFIQYPSSFYEDITEITSRIISFQKMHSDIINIVGEPLDCEPVQDDPFKKLNSNNNLDFDFEYLSYALQRNIPVMIDNLTLRSLFNNFTDNNADCGSFGLITYINYVASTDRWSNDRYYQLIAKLIFWGYRSFFINHHLFVSTMKNQGYNINEESVSVFKLFANKEYNDMDIIRIMSIVLFIIWKEPNDSKIKKRWSDLISEMIISRGIQYDIFFRASCKSLLKLGLTNQDKESLKDYLAKYRNW